MTTISQTPSDGPTVAVVGLGYVGLPLVVEFGRVVPTIGYDISVEKVESCRDLIDPSGEVSSEAMSKACLARYTNDPTALSTADAILVAVPTPVDSARRPDLGPLQRASETIGHHMKPGAIVVFESTVYPYATEEVCIPILERVSGRRWKEGFHVAYSPERINPGDREHTLTDVVKVVSGDTPETLERVAALYERVVKAGVHRASSIAAAEACKVIENTQRDLNIALMNELAIIFGQMGIDTHEVLQAAGTKWNFLPFKPGLVGGHCIGVDPYYLTHKAEMLGYHPQVILAGRRINDGMAKHVAEQTVKELIRAGLCVKGARINVLGATFKEDCTDIRNSKAIEVVRELEAFGADVFVHDPCADPEETRAEYNIQLSPWDHLPRADAMVVAVAHREFVELGVEGLADKLHPGGIVMDVKSSLNPKSLQAMGFTHWRL